MKSDITPPKSNSTTAPISSEYTPKFHKHYYTNAVQVKNTFEPIDVGTGHDNLYQMVEYAYMGCNCGSVVKNRVNG